MIVVHHLNNSRSQRVLWMLEELGVEYEIRFYERNPETMLAPPELRQVLQATVVDGLSAREAAHLLGLPLGTVKSRTRIAKSRLREQLISREALS